MPCSDATWISCHKTRRWDTLVGPPLQASLFDMNLELPFHEGSAVLDFTYLQHYLKFFCINSEAKFTPWTNAEYRVHPSISSFFLLFLFSCQSLLPQERLRCVHDITKLKDTVTFRHPWRHSQQSANVKKKKQTVSLSKISWYFSSGCDTYTEDIKLIMIRFQDDSIPRNSCERGGGCRSVYSRKGDLLEGKTKRQRVPTRGKER